MEISAWSLLGLFLIGLGVLAWPLGKWLAALCDGRLPRWMHVVERPLYKMAGVAPDQSMHWHNYALAMLAFNALGALAVYGLQRLQHLLPLNPQGMGAVSGDSSFNTAISFVTNTNWQGYAGESTMSYLTQMLGLSVQNFLSAATGIAVAFALARGFAARRTDGQGYVGNFWTDVTRITAWVLVPASFVIALVLIGQGVIQNFDAYKEVATLEQTAYEVPMLDDSGQPVAGADGKPVMEGKTSKIQTLAMGPVASQEAIKMLGTNGGGFFNANSAHPYENPTALTSFVQMLAIFLIPTALCFAFGRVVGDQRQGVAILAAMTVMFVLDLLHYVKVSPRRWKNDCHLPVRHSWNIPLRICSCPSPGYSVVLSTVSCSAVVVDDVVALADAVGVGVGSAVADAAAGVGVLISGSSVVSANVDIGMIQHSKRIKTQLIRFISHSPLSRLIRQHPFHRRCRKAHRCRPDYGWLIISSSLPIATL